MKKLIISDAANAAEILTVEAGSPDRFKIEVVISNAQFNITKMKSAKNIHLSLYPQ